MAQEIDEMEAREIMRAQMHDAARMTNLLQKRARPSGSMCCACIHRFASCSHLPFDDMPTMRLDKDGRRVVRCVEFKSINNNQRI